MAAADAPLGVVLQANLAHVEASALTEGYRVYRRRTEYSVIPEVSVLAVRTYISPNDPTYHQSQAHKACALGKDRNNSSRFRKIGLVAGLGRVAGLVGIKLLTTSHPVQKAPISPDGESNDSHRTRFSVEFYRLTRSHLKPDGIYYFNTTQSDETIATALSVCPYGFRVFNLLAISETPITFNTQMWLSVLGRYKIDGRNPFDSADPVAQRVLARSALLQRTLDGPPTFVSIETSDSIRRPLGKLRLITDDNMGSEWQPHVVFPWR
jgi:hypothetical protein